MVVHVMIVYSVGHNGLLISYLTKMKYNFMGCLHKE